MSTYYPQPVSRVEVKDALNQLRDLLRNRLPLRCRYCEMQLGENQLEIQTTKRKPPPEKELDHILLHAERFLLWLPSKHDKGDMNEVYTE